MHFLKLRVRRGSGHTVKSKSNNRPVIAQLQLVSREKRVKRKDLFFRLTRFFYCRAWRYLYNREASNGDVIVAMDKIWLTPLTVCDCCNGDFHGVMYDAAVPAARGIWGNICEPCFREQGCRTGIGRGQRYELMLRCDKHYWIGTEGFER